MSAISTVKSFVYRKLHPINEKTMDLDRAFQVKRCNTTLSPKSEKKLQAIFLRTLNNRTDGVSFGFALCQAETQIWKCEDHVESMLPSQASRALATLLTTFRQAVDKANRNHTHPEQKEAEGTRNFFNDRHRRTDNALSGTNADHLQRHCSFDSDDSASWPDGEEGPWDESTLPSPGWVFNRR